MPIYVLSIEEVCRELGMSRDTFLTLVAEDKAPILRKLGRRQVILLRDFEVWLAELPRYQPGDLEGD